MFLPQPGPSTNKNLPSSNSYSGLLYQSFNSTPAPPNPQPVTLIMGRRQFKKGAGETIQYQIDIEIAPIIYTKQQFEEFKSTIATFAAALISKNKQNGMDVSRSHVIALWIINVQRVYAAGDPKREELLDQVSTLRYTSLEGSVPLTGCNCTDRQPDLLRVVGDACPRSDTPTRDSSLPTSRAWPKPTRENNVPRLNRHGEQQNAHRSSQNQAPSV